MRLQLEHVAGNNPGPGDIGSSGTGRLFQPSQKGDPHMVDQIIGQLGGDDLAAQTMSTQRVAPGFEQHRREGGFKLARKVCIFGYV